MRTFTRTAGLVACASVVFTGCSFKGVQSMTLPGTGTGQGAYEVTVELPNVGTLTPNGQVKVGDVAVGTVRSIEVADWHAVATVSLEKEVELPENAIAAVGVNSLLGSAYIELSPPTGEVARGRLADGDTITLDRGSAYPSTEQVLASASVVLNGGGLDQLNTITSELNRALGGNGQAVKSLLPRLNSFVGELDAQKGDILTAIDELDRLSARFASKRHVLNSAVEQLAPALATLNLQRKSLTSALTSLGKLGEISARVIQSSKADLVTNLRDLRPTLLALSDAGESIVKAVGFATTFPFAPETVANACRGDYCNLFLTLNLTADALANGLLPPIAPTSRASAPSKPASEAASEPAAPLAALTQGLPEFSTNILDQLLDGLLP